eukprot:3485279-Heterocapsa_arctica.AAC.1
MGQVGGYASNDLAPQARRQCQARCSQGRPHGLPPCEAPSGLRKRPHEDDDESDDRPLRAKGPYRARIVPGSLGGRPMDSHLRHRPESNSVEPPGGPEDWREYPVSRTFAD